jgi:hypothetical protein
MVITAAAIVVAGGLMASNMGFKLNYQLTAATGGVSKSGFQTIALPYNAQTGMTHASHLFTDIAAGGVVTPTQLQRFNPLFDTYDLYPGPTDYTLDPGVAYFVKVATTGPYIIVGSHDPGHSVIFKAAAPGVSKSGFNLYAPPYHGTSAVASQLFAETSATQIQRFNPLFDTYDLYPGPTDYTIDPGVGYFVKVSADKTFVPAHY